MFDLKEAFKLLDELSSEEDKHEIINIDVCVECADIDEDLPSGNINDKYDEQTLEEWYDFAANVEGIIDSLGEVVNVSLSKQPDSLSEYIDFYSFDKNGNKKNYLIDLRLSDHAATSNSRRTRKHHVSKLNPTYEMFSIIVNNNSKFKSYSEAINYLRQYLVNKLMN